MKTLPILIACSLAFMTLKAEVLRVPQDHATIQAGIDGSNDGDTVLVDEGAYVENVNFRGKNIVVCSYYAIDGNTDHIAHTIIDGSQPAHADTGSCVLIISGEDSTAQLIGFTITGGTGTKFRDQSDNLLYVEGGGIIIEESNPVIAHNVIRNNAATRVPPGVQSAGGGGIRAGYCSPTIRNNVIIENTGRYGGGVVFFFADPVLHNNVVAMNTGGLDYGGGGVWIGGAGHNSIAYNNDIVGNSSALTGGGVRVFGGTMTGHSNIIWGNRANSGSQQVAGSATTANLDYCCVQGGWNGDGNINEYPDYLEGYLNLAPESPCIDAGHPDAQWNDQDGTRCNMGYLGGQSGTVTTEFGETRVSIPQPFPQLFFNCDTVLRTVHFENRGVSAWVIFSTNFVSSFPLFELQYAPTLVSPLQNDSLVIYTPAAGGCVGGDDTLLIFHNDPNLPDPLRIPLYLDPSGAAGDVQGLPTEFAMLPAFPNPFNSSTTLRVALPDEQRVVITIYNMLGRVTARVADEICAPGYHNFTWNAEAAASGSYVARVTAGKNVEQIILRYVK